MAVTGYRAGTARGCPAALWAVGAAIATPVFFALAALGFAALGLCMAAFALVMLPAVCAGRIARWARARKEGEKV